MCCAFLCSLAESFNVRKAPVLAGGGSADKMGIHVRNLNALVDFTVLEYYSPRGRQLHETPHQTTIKSCYCSTIWAHVIHVGCMSYCV